MVFLSVCTAIYDYVPQSEGELAIVEGELLYILEKSDEDDWWKAKRRARGDEEDEPIGLVPNNYVEEARPTLQAKAIYDYDRQTDEEVSFKETDTLKVYDNESDPDWTLVGLDDEYGFAPSNYIEIVGGSEQVASPPGAAQLVTQYEEPESPVQQSPSTTASAGPAAAIAGIMHGRSTSTASGANPALPARQPQYTPEASDEEPPPPSLPRRPPSEQLSPPPTQYASPRIPDSPGVAESPPHNRAVHQTADSDRMQPNAGGFHLYNISEMVSAMGKSKKLPTTLGLNLATGKIMIAPEKSRDGPTLEWSAEKLTHYSIEGKHVFMELVRPSKSIDFHAGAKDTAQEIVAGLGEIAGASRAEGLREVLEAVGGGSQKRGIMSYLFEAQGDDEVTVAAGDQVIIIDDTKSDEWWMVRRLKDGREGVVPSSYVEPTPTPAPSTSGINAGKSIVEQNRLEEERLAKEALKASTRGSEVGPGIRPPERGSSLTTGDGNKASQRGKRESKKDRGPAKSKPETSKLRTWTDRSGSFKVEAQFIGLKDGKIHLHKLNGVKIAVPVGKMAMEDIEYVEKETGVSLDDDKPLSDIKRRSTQSGKGKKGSQAGPKAGVSIEQPKTAAKEGPEYDWFDFFLKAGVSPYQCERYAHNFKNDSMDENILPEITPSVLRTLGLKEGDILRVSKYLDTKFNRNPADRGASPDGTSGGLFSGAGGALRNNTRKGRPAPAVESKDVVDESAFRPRENGNAGKERQESVSAEPEAPPPPRKNSNAFDDNAWDVKPSRKPSSPAPAPSERTTSAQPPQNTLSGNLLDLSLLSPPLEPTRAPQTTAQQQAPAVQSQPSQLPPQQLQQPQQPQQPQQQQPTGANPQFFSQLGPSPTGAQVQHQNTAQGPQGYNQQQFFQNQQQQVAPPRQRPQAPPAVQQGSLMPPPPARPLSAPQTQPQNNTFGPTPLQPQLTGYQPQNQIAPPGQSLNELSQQRFQQQQQQQFNQQPQQFSQPPLQAQQTGYNPQNQNFGQFNQVMMPQSTGFGQNPYVNGQQAGSPFADPRLQPQQTGFQQLQQQPTGYQPQFQPSLQPQQTGVNSFLPPALQPQQTGINGYSRPAFGQPPPPVPPMPPMPQQQQPPPAAPLQPQKTGPAPPVRFGTTAANKLVPQPTGRKANLSAATPSNPFGF